MCIRDRPSITLSEKNFQKTVFDGLDLSGKDLSKSSLWYASFKNTNLEDTNLRSADLMKADLTKTKNKSLSGANLVSTSFLLADLSGVNLSNAILDNTNFLQTELVGVDFSVISNIPNGVIFKKSTLTNSNFEGGSLSPTDFFTDTFKNKAHLKQEFESGSFSYSAFVVQLFCLTLVIILIISTEFS